MPKTRGKQNQKRPVVSIRPIATIDSDTRVSRAIDILLKAAAEANSQSKDTSNGKKPGGQAHAEDALTRGSGGNDSHGEG